MNKEPSSLKSGRDPLYGFLERLTQALPEYMEIHAAAMHKIASAETVEELAIALDTEKREREEVAMFAGAYSDFIKLFDPLNHFASEKHKALADELMEVVTKKVTSNSKKES